MNGVGVAALIATMSLAPVAPSVSLRNADFESDALGQAPPGWSHPAAMEAAGYHVEVSDVDPHSGKTSARLWRDTTVAERPHAFGSIAQPVDITALRGHRIRYSAAVRVTRRSDHIGLWLRVDAPGGKPAFFDNMRDRPITASGWSVYTIEGYVPEQATGLLLGLLVTGDGDARIDSAGVEDLGLADDAPVGEAKAYLDHALDLLEKDHINSANADWPKLRAEAYRQAGGATTPRQTHAAIRSVIASLGERHTFLRPPVSPTPDSTPDAPRPAAASLPSGRMQGAVARLSLPRLTRDIADPKDDGAPYQAAITAFVKAADAGKACGWVIDLRGHGGGDMWPGMRGLAPLLGEGPPGAFVGKAGRKPWPATSATIRLALSHPDAPVAVLLGPRTASAGEMIAIGFVGRPNTRSFGQPTAGLTTANAAYPLSDGAVLAVTSAYVEDRQGRRYAGPMIPDESVPPDGAEQAALAWLAAQGCR
jgi:carboxyl-terminal processing protease